MLIQSSENMGSLAGQMLEVNVPALTCGLPCIGVVASSLSDLS